ncbi:MAG: SDR family oxidoreductase [Bifidobacteriaceae bacterium]|jgi:NAD(P)-dependent dehydrogenase (short-subunit alcohol dehydrogenase family)|nr:SDR family oxidoreductase [Bifidobacteriaceae bacterium]
MFDFKGKTAFVTGGASGIGHAIARRLATEGCKVAMADVDQSRLASALDGFPGEAMDVRLDVRDAEAWRDAKAAVEQKLGPVSVLINCAGIMDNPAVPMPERGLVDYPFDQWDRMIDISLTGIAYGIMTFGRDMRERRLGHIVNTSSTQGLIPTAGVAAYSASKCGVVGLSEAVRDELSFYGVGVSVLFPGMTATRLASNAAKRDGISNDRLTETMPGLDPAVTAAMVVDAINNNKLYILTHGEYRKFFEDRCMRMVAAFTEVPTSPGYDPAKPLPGTREWANNPAMWGFV